MGSTVSSSVPNARELLAEFKATGDQHAYEEIVRRYAGMVYGVCLRTTKNPHDAEDATQAVFLSLAVQCKTGDGVKFVGPWLQQVAKRVSLDIKRSRKRREAREHRHHTMNGNGNGHTEVEKSGAVDVDELKVVLSEELNALPSKYRLPLVLHYFGGMTRDEMARELNCKPATLGVRIHRGREMLGRRLHERGAAPPGLVLSALITGAIAQRVADAMVARTVEAACKLSTGQELGSSIAANVLAMSQSAAAGAAMAAKLKTIAAIVLVALLTVCTGGAVAKLAPELKIPDVFKKSWLPKFRSPLPSLHVNNVVEGTQAVDEEVPEFQLKVALQPPLDYVAPSEVAAKPVLPGPVASNTADAAPVKPAPLPSRGAVAKLDVPAVTNVASADRLRGTTSSASLAVANAAASQSNAAGQGVDLASVGTNVSAAGDVQLAKVDETPSLKGDSTSAETDGATYLSIGSGAGGAGHVGVSPGGTLSANRIDVGLNGDGTLDVNGGTASFDQLRIAANRGSRGTVNVRNNGKLIANRGDAATPEGTNGIVVGGEGDGAINLGDANSTGLIMAGGEPVAGVAEPDLIVRATPVGSGIIRGHGTINLGGTLENNGITIADGFGHGRTLDFDGFTRVINTIENPPVGGTQGWFATDGARLALPRIRVHAGTGAYTWGESDADDLIDLVNSSRITLQDVPADGFMQVSLMALDRGGVPPLPKGHTFIGIWQLDLFNLAVDAETGLLTSSPMDPSGIDLAVRYDDALAAQLGLDENVLKLWKYQDGKWQRIFDGFERFPDTNILVGHTAGGIEYYAVSAPEPGAITLLMLGAGGMLARRPRRQKK